MRRLHVSPQHAHASSCRRGSRSLVLAGCGGSDGGSGNSGTKKSSGVQLYFVDGNTADYSGDFDKGTLNGVRATFPGASSATSSSSGC